VRPPPVPGWYAWFALLLSTLGVGIGAVIIAVHVSAASDRKWCSVVVTLDDAWTETPPTTPAGVNLARDFARLRQHLDCPAR
jgi:hypothetical protein